MTEQESQLFEKLESLKRDIESYVQKERRWNRTAEKLSDKLGHLAGWIHDYTHRRDVKVDTECPVYQRSTLKRVRKALYFEV